jgi:glycine betaine/proline transport system ATP-binding protein
MTKDIKIQVDNIFKIFGPDPASVLEKVKAGTISKSELLAQSDHVIGLRDISLQIPAGETFVIMGLSGSGKSTLIRHFNRLIEPTAGRILIDGVDVLGLSTRELRDFRRHKISMVFQRFALLPHKTVLENVIYGLRVSGMDRKTALEKGREQIELVGLSGFANQYPSQLSGGMQQRVGLARALATDADILLMDEAFSALDPLIRNEMQDQLKDLQARLHKTILFITHDLDEALRIGDTIAILKDGELRQVGKGADILINPADDYVRRFVKDVNRSRVVKIGALMKPVEMMSLRNANYRQCQEILDRDTGVALCRDDDPVQVFSPDMKNALTPSCIDDCATRQEMTPVVLETLSLEECFPSFAKADGALLVRDEKGAVKGMVSMKSVMAAL